MIVNMFADATTKQIEHVVDRIKECGFQAHLIRGEERTVIGIVGNSNKHRPELEALRAAPGVEELVPISHPFKPRSSPYSFQGLGEDGLKMMRAAADTNGLLVVSEVMDPSQIEAMLPYVDVLQVGARNMQNYHLLRALGELDKPVMLKRGMSATLEELLLSAEYILSGGNYKVILCERGIRTFETYTRNTLDIAAIPVVKQLSHLPIIADPSHGTGRRDKVAAMARAAVAAGADGLIIEVHPDPERALSDGVQSLYPDQFAQMMDQVRAIAPAVGRTIAKGEVAGVVR
jgi:3-deoxy-7-phosphoheptulonate synthase